MIQRHAQRIWTPSLLAYLAPLLPLCVPLFLRVEGWRAEKAREVLQ